MRHLVCTALAFLLLACGSGDRIASPTTRFVAVRTPVSAGVVTFVVEDGYGHTIYAPGDRFAEPVRLVWDADERLWISTTAGVVVWAPHDVGAGWAPLTRAERVGLVPPAGLAPR